MPDQNVICLVVDRLHQGMVGAYGNTWIRTHQLDRLACQSFLFDQACVDSLDLERLYRAYWFGLHAHSRRAIDERLALPRLLRQSSVHTTLVTDEPSVSSFAAASDFAEVIQVGGVSHHEPDNSLTRLEHLFATVSAWLARAPRPFCLWIHAQGMAAEWDAPLEMRNAFTEEEDPAPPDFVDVPNLWLPENYDPDRLLGIVHAYAGQMALLDQCLGALLDELDQTGLASNAFFNFISARGFPLGEHRRVGPCDGALYNEATALVWMMRFPDRLGQLARSSALVQPADLYDTLVDWLGLPPSNTPGASSLLPIVRDEVGSVRQAAHSVSPGEQAVRTPAWLLRQPVGGVAELYAKPSDRWEVNEVAKLCPDVVTALQAVLSELDRSPDVPPGALADELVAIVD